MTKCKNCGGPLKPTASECSYCGGAVEVDPGPPIEPIGTAVHSESDSPPPRPPLPAGWVRTIDSWAGYSVAHPPQWKARCEDGVITVSQDRTRTVQAFVWPIQLRSGLHAQQVAQEYFTWAKVQNEQLEAWLIPTSEPFPRRVVMRTRSQQAGQRVDGVLTVDVWGSNALIRGFHGPRASCDAAGAIREAQTLTNVVGSFQVESPTPRQSFREPSQGAFDALVPTGWVAKGRLTHTFSRTVPTCEYSARKDSAGLTQVAVPSDMWQSADGPLVGLCMLGLMGMRRFEPAGKFGPEMVARRFKKQVHQHVEDVGSAPHVLPRFYADLARMGMDPRTAETSTACVVSNHLVGGVRIRQKSFIGTARVGRAARWTSELAGLWFAELLSYYHAPESEFESVEPILAGVADSFQINKQWVEQKKMEAMQTAMIVGAMLQQQAQQQNQMMQQQMAQRHASITHNQDHIHQTIMSTWQERNRVMDHVNHQWSNVTRGCTDVVDSSYGTVYSVPNDYDQYWRTNSGTFIGGSWGTQPDPSWHELTRIRI